MAGWNAVLFDVDGTLIDSAAGIAETFAYTFRQLGVDASSINYNRFLGPPLRRSFAEFLDTPKEIEKAVEIYRSYYKNKGSHMCTLYPGVHDMLRALKNAGITLCTATSKPTQVVKPILRNLGIEKFFYVIGGASADASIDTKTAVIQNLLSQKDFQNKRILMVGDRQDDMIGAAESGLQAVGVLYGYGSKQELSAHNPLFLASDCRMLTDFILEGISHG